MNNPRPRGRPREATTTRADILAIARRRFLAEGYDRVSLRAIAREAGVDVALISYYFASKKGLFGDAMALVVNPADKLAQEISGPLNSLPERLVLAVVTAWEDPASAGSLKSFLEAVVRDADVARVFRELIEREMLSRIADRVGGRDATRRAAVTASHIAGMVMARYIICLEPIASMSPAELARWMAPSLRAALSEHYSGGSTARSARARN
jgi:AcrR family transcriptional regulator